MIDLRRRRSAKIVATLGPSSSTPERISDSSRLVSTYSDFNFSHGTRGSPRTIRRDPKGESRYGAPDRRYLPTCRDQKLDLVHSRGPDRSSPPAHASTSILIARRAIKAVRRCLIRDL